MTDLINWDEPIETKVTAREPQAVQVGSDDELIDRLIAERDVANVRITELLIRVRDLERVNKTLRERIA